MNKNRLHQADAAAAAANELADYKDALFKAGVVAAKLQTKIKRLKNGLRAVRHSTEIMEARRFAERALKG